MSTWTDIAPTDSSSLGTNSPNQHLKTYLNVARYHMVQRLIFVTLPWAVLAFAFAVNLVIDSVVPSGNHQQYTGSLAIVYVYLFIGGVLSVARSLPFGLSLGVSRRTYYLGTVGHALGLGAVYGLALTLLQAIERATGGWGLHLNFFRVPYILDGPWYLTWLTSFVVLTLLYVYGMWFGLVYRRWSMVGLWSFIAAQVITLVVGALLAVWTDAWGNIGQFFTTLNAAGLTGVLAALAAALAVGGFATMRRITV